MSAPGSDIRKINVFDDRILQTRQSMAVIKSGSSITNQPINAITQNAGSINFQYQVPSQQSFVAKNVDFTSTYTLQFNVVPPAGTVGDLLRLGIDFSLAGFPLQSAVNTLTPIINSTSLPINSADVNDILLRLTDYAKVRGMRTCPTKLSSYLLCDDDVNTNSTTLGGFGDMTTRDELPNGAYPVSFCDPNNGNVLSGSSSYTYNGVVVNYVNGIPQVSAVGSHPVAVQFTATEKLLAPPFQFRDDKGWSETGLTGIQNITVQMTLGSPARCLRFSQASGRTYTAPVFASASPNGGVQNSRLDFITLSPSLELPLPPKSSIPSYNLPRYLFSFTDTFAPGTTKEVFTSSITLNRIPDSFIVAVRPQTYAVNENSWFFAVQQVSIDFDNQSALGTTYSQAQLYQSSLRAGLELTYPEFQGECNQVVAGTPTRVPLIGAPVILKPAEFFAVSTGLASGSSGNFVFRVRVSVKNQSATTYGGANPYQVVLLCPEPIFVESVRGSTRILSSILDSASVLSAESSDVIARSEAERMIGSATMGGGMLDKLSNMITTAKSIYDTARPIVSKVKEVARAIPHEKGKQVASTLDKLGFGAMGGLNERLM
jgi:hypothetical protein